VVTDPGAAGPTRRGIPLVRISGSHVGDHGGARPGAAAAAPLPVSVSPHHACTHHAHNDPAFTTPLPLPSRFRAMVGRILPAPCSVGRTTTREGDLGEAAINLVPYLLPTATRLDLIDWLSPTLLEADASSTHTCLPSPPLPPRLCGRSYKAHVPPTRGCGMASQGRARGVHLGGRAEGRRTMPCGTCMWLSKDPLLPPLPLLTSSTQADAASTRK
jgi:hypothetical protein